MGWIIMVMCECSYFVVYLWYVMVSFQMTGTKHFGKSIFFLFCQYLKREWLSLNLYSFVNKLIKYFNFENTFWMRERVICFCRCWLKKKKKLFIIEFVGFRRLFKQTSIGSLDYKKHKICLGFLKWLSEFKDQ